MKDQESENNLAEIQISNSLMTYEEQKAGLIKKALNGKCPIRFIEGDGEKIDFGSALIREPYKTSEEVIKDLTATTDINLATEIFVRGSCAIAGKNEGKKANIAVQVLADDIPQDSTEARLKLQANALYSQGMAYLSRAEQKDMMCHCEFYMKNAMKLLRLHNETIEVLSKYRRGGEQRVIVQHVQVSDGGQAIVNNGSMNAVGEGKNKK